MSYSPVRILARRISSYPQKMVHKIAFLIRSTFNLAVQAFSACLFMKRCLIYKARYKPVEPIYEVTLLIDKPCVSGAGAAPVLWGWRGRGGRRRRESKLPTANRSSQKHWLLAALPLFFRVVNAHLQGPALLGWGNFSDGFLETTVLSSRTDRSGVPTWR